MSFEYSSGIVIDLHLPRTRHPGPLEAEIEPADTGE